MAGVTFSNVMMAIAKPGTTDAVSPSWRRNQLGPAPWRTKLRYSNKAFFFASWQNDNQAEVLSRYATDKGATKKVYLMALNYQSSRDPGAGAQALL